MRCAGPEFSIGAFRAPDYIESQRRLTMRALPWMAAGLAAAPAMAQVRTVDAIGRDGATVVSRVPHSGPGLALQRPGSGNTDTGWQLMTVPAGVYIRAISMGTPTVGFAAAEQGVVLRSTDGGNTWQTILN